MKLIVLIISNNLKIRNTEVQLPFQEKSNIPIIFLLCFEMSSKNRETLKNKNGPNKGNRSKIREYCMGIYFEIFVCLLRFFFCLKRSLKIIQSIISIFNLIN